MEKKSYLIWIMVLVVFFPFAGKCQQYLTYTHGGIERDYILYKPSNLHDDAPLVFVLHGYSGSAQGIMNYSGMNKLANTYRFAVCYPQGTSDDWGNNFWQVGYDFHQNKPVDDVGFITALADYLHTFYNLSEKNTFVMGMSNGGDMSYLLACQASGTFRASAPVAGCMMKWIYDSCNPDYMMPVFATNGTDDETTWWNGDINNTDGWGAYMGVMDAIEFWKEKNITTETEITELPDNDPNDGSTITHEMYYAGKNNHLVSLYKLVGGGHDWPGAWGNMDVDISEEIWHFFEWVMENSVAGINDEDIALGSLRVFPNPVIDNLTIESNLAGSKEFVLSNLNGLILQRGIILGRVQLDLTGLKPGVYLLTVNNIHYKIIKTR